MTLGKFTLGLVGVPRGGNNVHLSRGSLSRGADGQGQIHKVCPERVFGAKKYGLTWVVHVFVSNCVAENSSMERDGVPNDN